MSDSVDFDQGPCPLKQDEKHTCWGNRANGPIICNMLNMQQIRDICDRYYIMADLKDIAPNLWQKGGVCCEQWRYFCLKHMEPGGGWNQGCFSVLVRPNDNKMVQRNFTQLRFEYCPFCGNKVKPSPNELNEMWAKRKEVK